jgi:hypothetical protein
MNTANTSTAERVIRSYTSARRADVARLSIR